MKNEPIRELQVANSSASASETSRKQFLSILAAVLTMVCLFLVVALLKARSVQQQLRWASTSDLDLNGYIISSQRLEVDDADPGKCSVGAYGYVNSRLERLAVRKDLLNKNGLSIEKVTDPNDIQQIRGINPEVKIFLIPVAHGYQFMIVSSRMLSNEEYGRIHELTRIEITQAVNEWNSEDRHKDQQAWIPNI